MLRLRCTLVLHLWPKEEEEEEEVFIRQNRGGSAQHAKRAVHGGSARAPLLSLYWISSHGVGRDSPHVPLAVDIVCRTERWRRIAFQRRLFSHRCATDVVFTQLNITS